VSSDGPAEGGRDEAAAGHDQFPVVESTVTYEGVMSTLRVDRIATPSGRVTSREVAQRPDAVAVVPLTTDDQVVMLRQYRHPVGRYELEIPAGLMDVAGEAEDQAAQRELAEEIGMAAGQLERLTRVWNSAGWTDEATTVFVGRDLRAAAPADDFVAEAEEADMEVVRMPLHEAVALARTGGIADAKTVIGLLLVACGGPTPSRAA
jgi:8-oxo-dGTP pyrophosphatase MutT (NUDIX family)